MSDTPDLPGEVSRRQVITRAAAIGAAIPAAGLLGACATGSSSEKKDNTKVDNSNVANPFGVKDDAALNVVIFPGGYSDKYATEVHEKMYKEKFPKATVKHEGIQDIDPVIGPRFQSGDVPDFLNNSGEKAVNMGKLVGDKQLSLLDKLWAAPSLDTPGKTVRDTLIPGTIESGSFNGESLQLNYVFTVYGLWFNANQFKEKGWDGAPKDFDAFTALCEKIKAAGVTPFGYAGANAAYYMFEVIMTSAAKIGGAGVLKALDNLEDGAWKHEAVLQAAEYWAMIGSKYSDKAFEGLKHTEVQLKQNQGSLAIYPSGSWLESEQKKDTPATFEYAMMNVPTGKTTKLPVTSVHATASEPYVIPAKAKNLAGALEYARIMLSKKGAAEFTKLTGSLTSVAGAADAVKVTPGTESAKKALSGAGKDVFTFYWADDYKDGLGLPARSATNDLFFGRIDAKKYVEVLQAAADKVKKDPSVTKIKR
ncbi:N-acetylglucosamine/diacetylchitobiose ABC transporter substrate-binding protein [Longispora albida]|uniref:N-acetylglucosamine/diacetylchitobiose ABC transporter substrate-binding protein n=1 Tax=Longispora albida TaxID=203523 RepID=UPI000371C32C|nr:N-acetylglucosamine/diacetylchitobiose ABC transporter substrate-binding protein [Longispora albida]